MSIIIQAYNEEKVLLPKIDNLRDLDFPGDRLRLFSSPTVRRMARTRYCKSFRKKITVHFLD